MSYLFNFKGLYSNTGAKQCGDANTAEEYFNKVSILLLLHHLIKISLALKILLANHI